MSSASIAPEPADHPGDQHVSAGPGEPGHGSAPTTSLSKTESSGWRTATGTRKSWLVSISRPFGHVLFHSAFRMRIVGLEHVPKTGAVLIAGNHTGFLDGPLLYAFSPRQTTILAKSELFVGPIGRALGWLGQVPIHRGRPDRSALRSSLAVLTAGGAMGVFPEGTRGAGTLEDVSDGFAWLALRSRAPIVPLAVIGTAEALPKGSKLPRWRAPVTLVFGPAVQLTVEGDPRVRRVVRAAAEELRLAMLAHVQKASALAPPRSGTQPSSTQPSSTQPSTRLTASAATEPDPSHSRTPEKDAPEKNP